MQAELAECWLCEATIAPDGVLIRYRDEQGRVHPWADRRGRWQPEYICRACALVYADCTEYDWSGVGCRPASVGHKTALPGTAREGRMPLSLTVGRAARWCACKRDDPAAT
jgi:hypothetical protein